MNSHPLSRRSFVGLTAAGAATLLTTSQTKAGSLATPDVIIGWTPWSDAEVVTKLAARVLKRDMNRDVELTLADIEAQFRTVARGEIDVMLMSWEPGLHAGYLRRYGADLVDLGELYEGNIGLAVPGWVPADLIDSIEDLARPEVQDALGGRIVGIDPGAGLMATTRQAMKDYGLGAYTLQEGTGPRMVREIALAERKQAPVVVTAWRPHMKFELYGMRYLKDPEGLYADKSSIHARANRAFPERAPEIAAMLSAMHLEITDIEQIMVRGRQEGIDASIDAWIAENPETVRGWLS